MVIRRLASVFLIVGLAGCSSPAPAPTATSSPGSTAERKYLLDRVDDAAIVQLYADGFTSLPLKQKTLIWHLYQAALAGRDIFIDQRHKDALEMRGVIEQIIAYPRRGCRHALRRSALREVVLAEQRSLQQPHARKFVLEATPDAFKAAVNLPSARARREYDRPGNDRSELARSSRCSSIRMSDPIVTNKTPGAGKDILAISANNLYSGVARRSQGLHEMRPQFAPYQA
jgi:dipeptidyl-peptidase-3